MDIERYLILVKNEDKTEQIKSCDYVNGRWKVTYYNNNTEYAYYYNNVERYKKINEINAETSVVYDNNQPISGVVRILDFGDYVRLLFKTGYKKVYPRSGIIIEETCLKNSNAYNCFEYLKKLTDYVGTKIEDDTSFLSKQYDRITLFQYLRS